MSVRQDSERKSCLAPPYLLPLISAHILMERIKSGWPNREFHNDSDIHHTCFKGGGISPQILCLCSIPSACRSCDAGFLLLHLTYTVYLLILTACVCCEHFLRAVLCVALRTRGPNRNRKGKGNKHLHSNHIRTVYWLLVYMWVRPHCPGKEHR